MRRKLHRSRRHSRRLVVLLLILTTVGALLAGLLAACGGVEGAYSLTQGEVSFLEGDVTLLLDGGKCTIVGKFRSASVDQAARAEGTYTVEGDTITLTIAKSTEEGTIEGDRLVFPDGKVWTKQ
jgi:hypothetical protein